MEFLEKYSRKQMQYGAWEDDNDYTCRIGNMEGRQSSVTNSSRASSAGAFLDLGTRKSVFERGQVTFS